MSEASAQHVTPLARPLIEARLQLAYPGFALNVDLSLPGRGVTVLFGPSGCGKTTVLRALAGLERARGVVKVQGHTWQDERTFLPTHRRPIGYVFQEASLFPHLTVQANLDYGRQRVPAADQRVNLSEAVELLGIGHLMDRKPDRLSGGERQRVAMARALLTSPQVLLMDEPLSALDAQRKAEVLPFLERLNRESGVPMVYVTHAMDEAARLADHLVLMQAGQVVAAGPAVSMLARLDLPLSEQDEAGAFLEGVVVEHDTTYGQSRLEVDGLSLWVGLCGDQLGQRVRARVLARDVSITLSPSTDSSIANILPARIEALREDGPDTVTLQLSLQGAPSVEASPAMLLARITRRSRDILKLHTGQQVHAQIKGVALMP
jgi:molybdate transport system ATP-binding protein